MRAHRFVIKPPILTSNPHQILHQQLQQIIKLGKRQGIGVVIDVVVVGYSAQGIDVKIRDPFQVKETMIALAHFSSDPYVLEQLPFFIEEEQAVIFTFNNSAIDDLNAVIPGPQDVQINEEVDLFQRE
jgi:hypothetical protein